jgi:hypothetical protein
LTVSTTLGRHHIDPSNREIVGSVHLGQRRVERVHYPRERKSVKLVLTLSPESFVRLMLMADERDVSVQELIRAVIIPEWGKIPRK